VGLNLDRSPPGHLVNQYPAGVDMGLSAEVSAEASGSSIRITWWGHATLLLDDRARILTDPLLTGAIVHLHRRAGLVPLLPMGLDAVAISHVHMDHLHLPSLALLDAGTPVLLPRGATRLLGRLPLEAVEVEAGDVIPVGDATVHVVPAVHDATRWPHGRVHGAAVGYVVQGAGATYFAGDTSVFPGMGDMYPGKLDVALLPVWGWGPTLGDGHMNPEQAAGCLPVLDVDVAVPIHYGTFWPRGFGWVRKRVFHEPGRDFAEHARRIAPSVDVRVLEVGTSTEVRLPTSRTTP
jgi:L-ascorbate metabolism protein UlaG (beta-lactamase superfamily)